MRFTTTRRELLQAGAGRPWRPTASAAAPSRARSTARPRARSIKPEIDGDLLIYNWAQYMDPALKKGFAEKYGVEVKEVNFDNLEAMVIKLRSGASYDLIWPSTEYVYRLDNEGLLAQFDRDLLRNSDNISAFYDSPWWDPNNELSDPLHLLHDRDRLAQRRGLGDDRLLERPAQPRRGGQDVHPRRLPGGDRRGEPDQRLRPQHPGRGTELETSKETLLEQKENARGFSTNSVQNLVTGTAVMHQAWNGDIVNVRNQVDDPESFSYETCKEGVPVGTDLMSIPITAKSPGTAMLFMDWIIDPEHAAQNVNWNGYPQPVEGGKQAFAELVKEEPSIDVDLEALADRRSSTGSTTRRRASSGPRPSPRSRPADGGRPRVTSAVSGTAS